MRFSTLVHAGLLISVVAGCGDVAEPTLTPPPELAEAPGLLMDGPPPFESLITPAIVPQGVPFLVTASSFGSSSRTEAAGHQSVIYAGAEIRLYGRIALDESDCTRDLRDFTRTLVVQFNPAGAAEVVVIG
jgi:hypothetical protein